MCLLVMTVSCDKTDELIEMPFGCGPRNHILDRDLDPPVGRDTFGGTYLGMPRHVCCVGRNSVQPLSTILL